MKRNSVYETIRDGFILGTLIFSTFAITNIQQQLEKLFNLPLIELHTKTKEMRVTGYIPTGNKTALMEDVIVGYTAAVSPGCIEFLGSKVYIKGYGVRHVNDLTHPRLDEEFGMCTIDLVVPTEQEAMKIGNSTSTVIRIN